MPTPEQRIRDFYGFDFPDDFFQFRDCLTGLPRNLLEDVCDNLFNSDPYYQQGGDMVRVGGMRYTCNPTATIGSRISAMTLADKPIEADKRYKVASWAPVAEGVRGEPVSDVVARYLRDRKVIRASQVNRPTLVGVEHNPGIG